MRPAVAVVVLLCAGLAFAQYTVTATRLNKDLPVLSSQNDQSVFLYNYNPAYVPGSLAQPAALLVRCQDRLPDGSTTGSVLAISEFAPGSLEDLTPIVNASVVFHSETAYETYGTEDPRVVLFDNLYYLFYSAVQAGDPLVCRLSLATSPQPSNASSWTRHGPLFPDNTAHWQWSKSGACLPSDNLALRPHYLLYGDSSYVAGLQVATSYDMLSWKSNSTIWLPVRNSSFFDSHLVEGGPPPLPLSNGNLLFVYNSAQNDASSANGLQYNPGYVILNGQNPLEILQRSDLPILTPTMAWEIGEAPYLLDVPNVVFVEGMVAVPHVPDTFVIYYGAADAVVGSAIVTVTF